MNSIDELHRDLDAFSHDASADVGPLRGRLADAAERAGILDVGYRIVDSPVGALLIAATAVGLVRVAFTLEGHDEVLQGLADQISPRVLRSAGRLDRAARQLDEYFTGHRHRFDLPVDWRLSSGFRSTVLQHLPEIDYGHTASYAAVARLSGSPKAVRAVGTACATNPVPIVVPCHRVVRSDGTIGNYRGGTEAKHLLLSLEGAA